MAPRTHRCHQPADSGASGPVIPVGSGPRFRWEVVQGSGGKWSSFSCDRNGGPPYRNGGPHGPERWTRSPEWDGRRRQAQVIERGLWSPEQERRSRAGKEIYRCVRSEKYFRLHHEVHLGERQIAAVAGSAKEPCSAICNGHAVGPELAACRRAWTTRNWRSCCFRRRPHRRGRGRRRTSPRSIRS